MTRLEEAGKGTAEASGDIVRLAGVEDLDDIAPLFDAYRQFYGRASDLRLARDFLRERFAKQDAIVFMARNPGSDRADAWGFAQIYPTLSSLRAGPIWILNDLFVAPADRGRGIARALLGAIESHARASNVVAITLSTERSNQTARRLYESAGYECDDAFVEYARALR